MTPERNRPSKSRRDEEDTDVLVLSRISNEMVQAQKKYFGRGPTQTKSYLLDDFLLVVMRGGMTTAESTMLEYGREDLVRKFRQEFENELAERLLGRMQELTGRTIINYQSQILFDPHTVVAMFFFEPETQAEAEADAASEAGTADGDPAPE